MHVLMQDVSNHIGRHENVAGQNDRRGKKVTGQEAFLAGHCPLTGRYFEPCKYTLSHPNKFP